MAIEDTLGNIANVVKNMVTTRADKSLSNLNATGEARFSNYADKNLSNLTASGENVIKEIAESQGGSSRNIGEIVASTIPLTDAGLHLLDGTIINGNGVYSDFAEYIAQLYADSPPQMKDVPFIQPLLSTWGNTGGDTFAVEAGNYASNRAPYMSFDGMSNTKWGLNNTQSGYITFYNPEALKVSSIIYTPSTDYPGEDGGNLEILGSNDNSNWTSLWTGSYTANSTQSFDVNSSGYYKYHRISISNANTNWAGLGDLSINAVYQEPTGIFISEQNWQKSVSKYGVCGKFVYTPSTIYYAWYNTNSGSIVYTTQLTGGGADFKVFTISNGNVTEISHYGARITNNVLYVNVSGAGYIGFERNSSSDTQTSSSVRLPKYSNKIFTGEGTAPVVGNGICVGLTDGTNYGGMNSVTNLALTGTTQLYGSSFPSTPIAASMATNNTGLGVTSDPTKSGLIADLSDITTALDGYYYIVVATSTKTAIQIDIDEITTDLNDKVNKSDLTTIQCVTDSGIIGNSWYRIWSDGWCEQGGITAPYSTSTDVTISLLYPYRSHNYSVSFALYTTDAANESGVIRSITKNSFNFYAWGSRVVYWRTAGYMEV